MADTKFDVIVIGAGPGGYVAAIRAAQLGLKTACVEKRETLGGTCLNVGCIPSKALLVSSEKFEEAKHGLDVHGVKVEGVSLDLPAMHAHRLKTVQSNVQGIEFLFRKNKVTWLKGAGKVAAAGKVQVTGADGATADYEAKHIVIATGSDVMPLPGVEIDEKRIVSSTGALELKDVPKHLVVIGGGVIGLELGSVWQRLGAKVTVVEFLDRILPGMDADLSKEGLKIFAKQGIDFRLSTKVTGAKVDDKGVTLTMEPAAGGTAETLTADTVLLAIGRRPYTAGLGLAEAGVKLDNRGRIEVDGHFQTNVPGIYAIGDVIVGPMLAHKAEEEGVVCVETIAGQKPHIEYNAIPSVVYTSPEIASVGFGEDTLLAQGRKIKVGKFPFSANGRARAMASTEGFVKIVADAETDRVLGVHIVGADAGTQIAEAAMAIEFSASAEDIARTCHAHPTLNEAVKEAALAVDKRAIHI